VKRISVVVVSLLVIGSLLASPAVARKRAARHTVSCKQIKEAVASGKSAEDVAKEMKVSEARVKACTAPPVKHHRRHRSSKPA